MHAPVHDPASDLPDRTGAHHHDEITILTDRFEMLDDRPEGVHVHRGGAVVSEALDEVAGRARQVLIARKVLRRDEDGAPETPLQAAARESSGGRGGGAESGRASGGATAENAAGAEAVLDEPPHARRALAAAQVGRR